MVEARPGGGARRAPAASAGPAPGALVSGRYRLDSPLPSDLPGARRWVATDQILARTVAVTLLSGPRTGAAVDAARRAALVTDPRLVRILDVGMTGDTGYVVTEAVEGRTLAALAARGPLEPEQARAIVGEAAAALEAGRRRGVHHLALRPDALHITPAGRVVVEGLAVDGELLGVDVAGAHATSRADTIGLVRLLYAALTGRWPEQAPTPGAVPTFEQWAAAGSEPAGARDAVADVDSGLPPAPVEGGAPVAPADLAPGVPADLDTLCAVTLGPHDDGPHSPDELVRELEPWRAVRADDLFHAADAGRWHALSPRGTAPGGAAPGGAAGARASASAADAIAGAATGAAAGAAAGAAGASTDTPRSARSASLEEPTPDVPTAAGAERAAAEVREPEAAEPDVTETEVPETEVPEPEASEPEVSEPQVPEPQVPEPQVPEPQVPEPQAPEPQVPEPQAPEPQVPGSEAAVPAVPEPEVPEADASADAATSTATAGAPGPVDADGTPRAADGPVADDRTGSDAADDPAVAAPGDPPGTDDAPRAGADDRAPDAHPTSAPPTGSSPMTDEKKPSTPDAAATSGAPAASGPAAGVARQSVRQVLGSTDARRPGTTPPPAEPTPPSFQPTQSGAPARTSTRPAAASGTPGQVPLGTVRPSTGAAVGGAAAAGVPSPSAPASGHAPAAQQPAPQPAEDLRPAWNLPFDTEPAPAAARQEALTDRRIDPTRWVLGIVGVGVIVGLVLALTTVFSPWDSGSDDEADGGTDLVAPVTDPTEPPAEQPAAGGAEAPAPVPPAIAAVTTIDPSDGDGEHEELVGALTDGDPATAWYTHTYNRPDYAGFKDGVGIVVTLQAPATVTSVTLDVNGSGGGVEVRSTDAANPTTGDVLASGPLNGQTVLTLVQPTQTQSLVLWFPSLAQTPDGKNRIEITNLAVS